MTHEVVLITYTAWRFSKWLSFNFFIQAFNLLIYFILIFPRRHAFLKSTCRDFSLDYVFVLFLYRYSLFALCLFPYIRQDWYQFYYDHIIIMWLLKYVNWSQVFRMVFTARKPLVYCRNLDSYNSNLTKNGTELLYSTIIHNIIW